LKNSWVYSIERTEYLEWVGVTPAG